MGFLNPTVPDVDPQELLQRPFLERIRYLSGFWADHGFGTPRVIHVVYLVKLAVFFTFGGFLVISLTSDVGSIWDFTSWWKEIVVYEKLILWTVLLETLGVAGSWGPLAGHFKPMTGGARYWLKPGIIRLPPWPGKVPLTRGDERTVVDVILYAALLVSTAVALVLPEGSHGMVRPGVLAPVIVLLVVNGLRDKIVFLAARGEQYLPAIVFMATLGLNDMVIALKLLIVVVWVGAGVSKIGEHFINVVPPMVSNAPFNPSKWLKRLHYRNAPTRPAALEVRVVHGARRWHVRRDRRPLDAPVHDQQDAGRDVCAVHGLLPPLHRVHLPAGGAARVERGLRVRVAVPLRRPPRRRRVRRHGLLRTVDAPRDRRGTPVLPGARQPASRPGVVPALDAAVRRQLGVGRLGLRSRLRAAPERAGQAGHEPGRPARVAFGYEPEAAEITMQITTAWRSMHSQGRGLYSLLLRHLADVDSATVREAEFVCNSIVGWNFGDGHLHDEDLIFAVQRRLNFAPGELQVMYVESQPVHKKVQAYRVIDAAVGVVERGTWNVHDAVSAQPWLPDGPIPLNVEWTLPGYVPAGVKPKGVSQ